MITPTSIYWISRLDSIHNLFCISIGILGIGFLFFGICLVVVFGDDIETVFQIFKRYAISLFMGIVICTVGLVFVPTTKEMAAILVIPRIANSETVQQLGDGIVDLAKDWLQELSPKKKGDTE